MGRLAMNVAGRLLIAAFNAASKTPAPGRPRPRWRLDLPGLHALSCNVRRSPTQGSSDPNVMGGKPVVAGTRITVEYILEQLGHGHTVEELLAGHPRLTREGLDRPRGGGPRDRLVASP